MGPGLNSTERSKNPKRASVGFSNHTECGIHWRESISKEIFYINPILCSQINSNFTDFAFIIDI